MLTEYQKFQLPDENGNQHIVAEVNWREDDIKTNESKIIRFTMPDGEKAYVKRENLNQVLFAIGRPEDQQKMIPQKIETVHHQMVQLGITAHKDIRKGEKININPITVSVPCTIAKEFIGSTAWQKEVKKKQSGGLIIPAS